MPVMRGRRDCASPNRSIDRGERFAATSARRRVSVTDSFHLTPATPGNGGPRTATKDLDEPTPTVPRAAVIGASMRTPIAGVGLGEERDWQSNGRLGAAYTSIRTKSLGKMLMNKPTRRTLLGASSGVLGGAVTSGASSAAWPGERYASATARIWRAGPLQGVTGAAAVLALLRSVDRP